MPAPHAFYSKMLAERTASRNVFVLFYFIYILIRRRTVTCFTGSGFRPPYKLGVNEGSLGMDQEGSGRRFRYC